MPEHVRFAFHDIVFSSFPDLSENDIRAISFELMKVIPVDAEPDVNFYAHIVTDDEMDSETLVRLFSLFPLSHFRVIVFSLPLLQFMSAVS